MKYPDYQKNVLARASREWHNDKVPESDAINALRQFIRWGHVLDRLKKTLFYGKAYYIVEPAFGPGEDQVQPLGLEPDPIAQQLVHAILGSATEAVEQVEALLAFFEGKPFDLVNLQEEFGDQEWYRALGLDALRQTHEANLKQNDAKLEKRYGPAFSAEKANERDLDAERQELENNGGDASAKA